jgi:AcrR family transcriptional regulator
MLRLSRQESQHQTRQRLIDAAEKEIIRIGIYEASIRRICEAAGYTLGAFYSNFADKDELLLEVLRAQTKREFSSLEEMVARTATSNEKTFLKKTAEWLRNLQKNKILTDLSLEFEVYAKHNSDFKKRYGKHKMEWTVHLAKTLETVFAGQRLTPQIPLMQMAAGLYALWAGFAIEGNVPGLEPADKVITVFIEALLESSKAA